MSAGPTFRYLIKTEPYQCIYPIATDHEGIITGE